MQGTPEFEGLLLSCCVLVRNDRGSVVIKEAQKEWNPPNEILYHRVGTGEGSYSFLIPFDSIVSEIRRQRSTKVLKKTRSRGITSEERV